MPALIDLSTVEEGRRSALWTSMAPSLFPGLSVDIDRGAPVGDIRSVRMGSGAMWAIRSSPAIVTYTPSPEFDERNLCLTLLMQFEGVTNVQQRARKCGVAAGDICIVDERLPFRLETEACTELLLLRMPRAPALSRHPHLERQTALLMSCADASVSLLGDTLASAVQTVPFMGEHQRRAALIAIMHLLGAAGTAQDDATRPPNWRVQSTLAFIELNFATPGLSAEQVAQAQRISRRRLDQLMIEEIGTSITGTIWNRRLEQSAADLRDPARSSFTAAQIAFANGFEDAAHFTRAFKRRYGRSPAQCRGLGLALAH